MFLFQAPRTVIALFAALSVAFSACSGEVDRVIDASQSLSREISSRPSSSTASPPTGVANTFPPLYLPPLKGKPILYIDATRSMAGFAGDGTPTNFDLVLDRLTTDLSITRVHRFGKHRDTGLLHEEPLGRNVHQSAFYDRLQNPDFVLYQAFLADSLKRTHIYLTDGVLSAEHGENPAAVVDALKTWLEQGRALAILAFRSRFAGSAWSEQQKNMIGYVEVDDRPFYFFVFAPSESVMDSLLSQLSSRLRGEATLLRFSPDAIGCGVRKAPLPVITEMTTPPWVMLPPDTYRAMTPENPGIVAYYTCDINEAYPLKTVRPDLNVRYRQWMGSTFTAARDELSAGTHFRINSTVTPTGIEAQIVAGLADDPLTRFGFFELALLYDPGVLKAAVESLSTDTDAHPKDFSQTYRFSWIVEQLVRHQFLRQRTPTLFFMTVQYS